MGELIEKIFAPNTISQPENPIVKNGFLDNIQEGHIGKGHFGVVKIGLKIDRGILYNKINRRVENMMKKGLLKEASSLMQYRNQNALQTVGYKELFKYLDGNTTLDQAVEEIKKNTRRFAKRQITWFNKDNLANEFLSNDMKGIIRFIV